MINHNNDGHSVNASSSQHANGNGQAGQGTDIQQALETCTTQLQEWKNRSLQISADFENFKKRSERDRAQWTTIGQSSVLTDILPIVDDIDRALTEAQKKEAGTDMKAFIAGLKMLADSLQNLLKKYGVQTIEQVTTFDPELHEALVHVESADHASGEIIEVLQKGYRHHQQILRPAKVSVAK